MGHVGNYSPEKIERLRSANAAADRAALATCELHDHGPDLMFGSITPCTTFNYGGGWTVHVRCAGCLRRREMKWPEFARTRISHEPWHVIFRTAIICSECRHGPQELYFSRVPTGGGAPQVGCISRQPPEKRPF